MRADEVDGAAGSEGDAEDGKLTCEAQASTLEYSAGPGGDEGAGQGTQGYGTTLPLGVWLQPVAAEPQQHGEPAPGVEKPTPRHPRVAYYAQDFINSQLVSGACWATAPTCASEVLSVPSSSEQQAVYWHYNPGNDVYSRKVFVGGVPADLSEDDLRSTFGRFGPLAVDWPRRIADKSRMPAKGYVFVVFVYERSVQSMVDGCEVKDDKLYLHVTSASTQRKAVQVRPWRLADADFITDASQPLDPRKTVFIGGVPRPLTAVEVAHAMHRLYGSVIYAGIDADPELKYPKGVARVAFGRQQSYLAALRQRFVQLTRGDVAPQVEVKPYVMDEQACDECGGAFCGNRAAPYFCPSVACLQYYCEHCWSFMHARYGREHHAPFAKDYSTPRRVQAHTSDDGRP